MGEAEGNRPFTGQELKFEVMTGIFGYYLRVYVTANFGEKYDNGVKLMLDSPERDGGAVCRDMLLRRQLVQDAFGAAAGGAAAAAETFNVAVYTVRHYYYDLKKGTISSTKTRHVRALVSNFMWIFCVRP